MDTVNRFQEVRNIIIAKYPENVKIADICSGWNKPMENVYLANMDVFSFDTQLEYRNHKPKKFTISKGKDFDLLVGIWACRCHSMIIRSAYKYEKDFILFPCGCKEEYKSYLNKIFYLFNLSKSLNFNLEIKKFYFKHLNQKSFWVMIRGYK